MADLIAMATDEQASVSREVSESMDKIATVTGSLKDSTDGTKGDLGTTLHNCGRIKTVASWFKVAT
jgi:hypothetical protein